MKIEEGRQERRGEREEETRGRGRRVKKEGKRGRETTRLE